MYMCIVCVFQVHYFSDHLVLNGDSVACSCLYNECSSWLSCSVLINLFDTDNGMLTWCQKWDFDE